MIESASQAVHRSWLDVLGAAVSMACAIQCATLPVLISVLPFPLLAGVLPFVPTVFRPGSGFDRVGLSAAIALAVFGYSRGFRRHRQIQVFAFLVLALCLLGTGWLWLTGRYQLFFVVAAALVLAAGHASNRRLCARGLSCHVTEPAMVLETSALKRTSALGIKGELS
jgi:hypothetical protein